MSHVEISGNTADGYGGAVYSEVSLTSISDGGSGETGPASAAARWSTQADVRDGLDGVLRLTRAEVDRNSTSGWGRCPGGSRRRFRIDYRLGGRRQPGRGRRGRVQRRQAQGGQFDAERNTSVTGGVLVNRGLDPKQDMFSTVGTDSLRNVTFAGKSAVFRTCRRPGPRPWSTRSWTTEARTAPGTPAPPRSHLKEATWTAAGPARSLLPATALARNPGLARLADNGGNPHPGATSGSPARDRAVAGACPSHDQRRRAPAPPRPRLRHRRRSRQPRPPHTDRFSQPVDSVPLQTPEATELRRPELGTGSVASTGAGVWPARSASSWSTGRSRSSASTPSEPETMAVNLASRRVMSKARAPPPAHVPRRLRRPVTWLRRRGS